MLPRFLFTLGLVCVFWAPACPAQGDLDDQRPDNTCLSCHSNHRSGFSDSHAFAANNCLACHAGNDKASIKDAAHEGMIPFPGDLADAERACGSCHADRVSSVTEGLMHTGHGMVQVTRSAFDEPAVPGRIDSLQTLGHGVADSMLRKQCASCHIGRPKTEHSQNVMWDRGGGCLACHISDYPEDAHPALTSNVSDARCFGCHGRSGRISLSYTGLAEIDVGDQPDGVSGPRLPDGRHVERMSGDVHYLAGMSCIDCHTSIGLMGGTGAASHQREAVDVSCADCHDNQNPVIRLGEWPASLALFRKKLPFAADDDTTFLTTRTNGTPLWHVELRDDGPWLHTKNTGRMLKIPAAAETYHKNDERHERLACASCHSQWAPQCFGCHMEFDPEGEQWDHVERAVTPGRWSDYRWDVQNTLPALGVNGNDQIELFVPGMIATIAHPDLDEEKFIRMFAPLSPHTTGKSRSCTSCHRSSTALGLGQGKLTNNGGELEFEPAADLLRDGLPADAWTNVDNSLGGSAPLPGQRPFNEDEMKAILDATIPTPAQNNGAGQ